MDAHLTKPIDLEELYAELASRIPDHGRDRLIGV